MSLDVSLNKRKMCSVYDGNITHNLGKMADAAGIYYHLWCPEEIEIKKAKNLIDPLKKGLLELNRNSKKYKKFNPSNGWGNHAVLVRFVENYIEACEENPNSIIKVYR